MNETINAWGRYCTAELTRHVTESVAELMPEGLRVLAGGLDVLLEKTSPGGAPRVVSTLQINPPIDFEATPLTEVAYHVLTDVQDQIAMYLRQPWPTNAAGTALHAWARERDAIIELAFRGNGANADAASIELPSFPVPPKPEATSYVG